MLGKFYYLVIVTLTLLANLTYADKISPDLKRIMIDLDNILFEQTFNRCALDKLESVIADDFEFYHDVTGLQNRQQFMDAVKNNICSTPKFKPIRKLVPGSMELFPLKNNGQIYGMIQRGVHKFYIKEPSKPLYQTSIAKFTHLWTLSDNQWKLKRVLSYDHINSED